MVKDPTVNILDILYSRVSLQYKNVYDIIKALITEIAYTKKCEGFM